MIRLARRAATVVIGCLIAIAIATTVACGSFKPDLEASSAPSTSYVNDEYHFSLQHDGRFEDIYPYQAPNVAFRVGFFDKDGAAPGLSPDGLWISVIDKKPDAGRDADERIRELKKLAGQLEAASPGGALWNETTVNGLPAAVSEDTSSANGYPRISYLVVGSRNVYLVVGSASAATWAGCRPLFVAACESFKEL